MQHIMLKIGRNATKTIIEPGGNGISGRYFCQGMSVRMSVGMSAKMKIGNTRGCVTCVTILRNSCAKLLRKQKQNFQSPN